MISIWQFSCKPIGWIGDSVAFILRLEGLRLRRETTKGFNILHFPQRQHRQIIGGRHILHKFDQ